MDIYSNLIKMKKYSEEFINNSDILKHSICGFEFEFFIKELSFYKTLELLNNYLKPVEVYGFKQYHPDFKPTENKFCLTPDLSGGSNMIEIITGPLPYFEAKYYLVKLLKFIQEYGYTNEKASVHFNISFEDKNLKDLNILKLILNIDEDEIYRNYPNRKNNVYAKSVKKIIPYKEYDFNNIPIDVVKNNLRLPSDKYYGINFLHIDAEDRKNQRLEFRYVGGKDYEKNVGQLIYFLDKFILISCEAITSSFSDKEIKSLEQHLDSNISHFKTFTNYDNFLVQYPTITLQIDQESGYDVVSAYYHALYDRLYILMDSTDNLKECIINWITSQQRLEIVDAKIKCTMNINDFDFINCIAEGIFENCSLINTKITNSQMAKCTINGCEITSSKILNCVVENSELKDCFFMNGYLNSSMEGGVFRSGKLGQYANVSSTTLVVKGDDNFFDTKFGEDDKKKKDGIIKKF
jgi:hypothetical protein